MSTPQVPKTPTITSAQVPVAPTKPQTPAQLPVFDGPIIVARALADPDFMAMAPVNPMHQLYWANRGYQNGHRVNYRVAQGFRLARKEDVKNLPESMVDASGQIINGDLVLMIIGKNAYQGALLNNHNKAIRRERKFGQVHQNWKETADGELVPNEEATDVVGATLSEVRASAAQRAKVSPFVPDPTSLDRIINSNPAPEKP